MAKCKWFGCNKEVEEEGFCSPWHKANYQQLMPSIRHVSEEWEFDFSPLKEDNDG
jgi:hypothetical protein